MSIINHGNLEINTKGNSRDQSESNCYTVYVIDVWKKKESGMGLAGWPTYTNGGKLLVGAQFTRAANPMLGRTIACRTVLTQTLQTKIDNVNFVCRL